MSVFSLTANNEIGSAAVWKSVALGQLTFPQAPNPYEADFDDTFWTSRHEEYNRLEWDTLDWHAIRTQLSNVAHKLEQQPDSQPELEFDVPSIRERTFLEMWFGYGDPSVEAHRIGQDRYEVGYGQHRICAYADYPMQPRDRDLMRIPASGFLPSGPLSPNTHIPMLIHDATVDNKSTNHTGHTDRYTSGL
ncbi:hypothetical protein BHAP_0986 [Bifidobacterium hapali]|uniref:Uncharacterized protein n=1 Tax=Bifidobacterium hapali TaxID=1630172 RepID=A0A261FZV6_9BIFI|nr:hypothetical protein [Bifidobacterium hapali]OZG64525.1 hypothetical protein BHAP_0986 [Bifidobacterium hapali]